MEHTKRTKNSSSILCALLILLSIAIALLMPTSWVNAKAETVEEEEQITVETIVDNCVFITFSKGQSEAKGQYMYACYFVPEEYYDSSLTYGVVVFPKWFAERYGVTGNYIAEYEALGMKDSLALLDVESPVLLSGGRLLKCGIKDIPESGEDIELSYIFYVQDSAGNYGYSSPHHAAYATLIAEDYTSAQIAEMIGQRVQMETSFKQIIVKLSELVDSFLVYIVIGCTSVVVIWGAYIGIKVAVARRREEQIDARGMVKNLIIGIVIAAVIAVGAPLLINGLSSWLAW